MIDKASVLEALSSVNDPELDEPITELGFVEAIKIEGDSVGVTLRLPTYFCAPNFAYIMAADAQAAVRGLDGVRDANISLIEHFASADINDGLARGHDFDRTFEADAASGLDELRDLFRRKAFVARQEQLCSALVDNGIQEERLSELRLADLPPSPETDLYLAKRTELGIATSPESRFLVTADGRPIPPDTLQLHLRFARTVRRSIEGNASFCRGLLETRYGDRAKEEVSA
jgi:metal-sulfur cluster biosynthetic enzyme